MITGDARQVADAVGLELGKDQVFAEVLPEDKHSEVAELQGHRKMIQNPVWAAGYSVAAIPLAAGALAWAGIVLAPAVAAVLMSASMVVVAINAQLLRRLNLRPAG
jgi:cation transport ATPase